MTKEQALSEIEVLNAEYNLCKMSRATYLKKHKSISEKYRKATNPTFYERIRKEGIKIKRLGRGYYQYIGKNFTCDFNEESCESTWWEVCIWGKDVNPIVYNHFEDYNQFDTKTEVVGALYNFDKSIIN
jgi:hypothetical protein